MPVARVAGQVVAIVQARMGSERLPGKVLADIAGQSMLERVVRRVQRARLVDRIVVATTTSPGDDVIATAAAALGATVTRGSENDVLDRFRQAAIAADAQHVVRVCADSPFVDPDVCDAVIDAYMTGEADYASNKLSPTFPLGLDVEIFSRAALERSWTEATESFQRSHVTVYMYRNPSLFRLRAVTADPDRHSWRWTVDTPEDLAFAREMFSRLGGGNDFSWLEAVQLIERNPDIAELNAHLEPKRVTEG